MLVVYKMRAPVMVDAVRVEASGVLQLVQFEREGHGGAEGVRRRGRARGRADGVLQRGDLFLEAVVGELELLELVLPAAPARDLELVEDAVRERVHDAARVRGGRGGRVGALDLADERARRRGGRVAAALRAVEHDADDDGRAVLAAHLAGHAVGLGDALGGARAREGVVEGVPGVRGGGPAEKVADAAADDLARAPAEDVADGGADEEERAARAEEAPELALELDALVLAAAGGGCCTAAVEVRIGAARALVRGDGGGEPAGAVDGAPVEAGHAADAAAEDDGLAALAGLDVEAAAALEPDKGAVARLHAEQQVDRARAPAAAATAAAAAVAMGAGAGRGLFELAHEGDDVGLVAKLGEGAADEVSGSVAEDAADGGGDVEEGALEGDDVDKVGGVGEQQEVEGAVAVKGVRAWLVGWCGGGRGGGGGRGEGDGAEEGGVLEQVGELGGEAGGGACAPVAGGCGGEGGGEGGGAAAVVDDVGSVAEFLEDGGGLLCEVDLEADVVDDVVGCVGGGGDGDDCDEVDEGGAALAVVDDAGLAFLVLCEAAAEVGDGLWCGVAAVLAGKDTAVGGLEEAAVAAEDLVLWVAGKLAEGGRGVHWRERGSDRERREREGRRTYGCVVAADVDDDKGACQVDGAEDDLWVWAGGDLSEDGEEVESGCGVDGEAEGGGGDGEGHGDGDGVGGEGVGGRGGGMERNWVRRGIRDVVGPIVVWLLGRVWEPGRGEGGKDAGVEDLCAAAGREGGSPEDEMGDLEVDVRGKRRRGEGTVAAAVAVAVVVVVVGLEIPLKGHGGRGQAGSQGGRARI